MRESDLNARDAGDPAPAKSRCGSRRPDSSAAATTCRRSRFESPFDGIVTRRNIEEGENVVVGTMNNAGTVLLTVADMSVIEAEVEVDETDIPLVQIGQKATVTIDAIDGKTFPGRVTEIGNSPIQDDRRRRTGGHAHGDEFQGRRHARRGGARDSARASPAPPRSPPALEDHRRGRADPGAHRARARVRQGRRRRAAAASAAGVPVELRSARPPARAGGAHRTAASATPARRSKGVFVISDGKATFVPVEVGIAGERYFEVSSGLKEGDRVITGPFDSVRNLFDGDEVRENAPAPGGARRERTAMQQTLGVGEAGAGVDLGEQAPVAADPARQHRRGVVDHRRRRPDPGRQRRRVRRHRLGPRRRRVHHPPHRHRAQPGRGRPPAQQPAHHPRRGPGDRALRHDHRRGDGAGAAELDASATAPRSCSRSRCRA